MSKAAQVQISDAGTAGIKLLIVFGDKHLTMTVEATVVTDELLDPLPHIHGADRERDLRHVPCQLAHPACIHA
jgi:hypothetical protein